MKNIFFLNRVLVSGSAVIAICLSAFLISPTPKASANSGCFSWNGIFIHATHCWGGGIPAYGPPYYGPQDGYAGPYYPPVGYPPEQPPWMSPPPVFGPDPGYQTYPDYGFQSPPPPMPIDSGSINSCDCEW